MKSILIFFFVIITLVVQSQPHIVIFNREDACYIEEPERCKRSAKYEIDFYESYKKAVANGFSQKVSLDLITPPLEWGKKVNDNTHGSLGHQALYSGGFVTELSLVNMKPEHNYRLCLNGRPDLKGNDLLPTPVQGNPKEKYYDILTIKTDASGSYKANLAILLKPGQYHVRFYVKDTDDFKIVLYHDYFPFEVR